MSFSLPQPLTLYWVVYDDTGYALRTGYGAPQQVDAQAQGLAPGEHVAATAAAPDFAAGVYVVNGEIRPCLPIEPRLTKTRIQADGADEVRVEFLPPGCSVFIAGAVTMPEAVVAGTSFVLTSTTIGKIDVFISKRPTHKQVKVSIDAQ